MDQGGHSFRRRAACDRCHSQKLRCVKPSGSDICARCLKARVSCVYSPSLRGYRSNSSVDVSVSNGFPNEPHGVSGFANSNDSFTDTMDWNAPGAFDILPEFGMVQGLSDFTLDDPIFNQDANGRVHHSPHSGTNDSTVSSGAMGSTSSSGNGIVQSSSGHVSETPAGTVDGSDLSKDDGGHLPAEDATPSKDPKIFLLRELTELSLKLYEHASSLPTLPTKEDIASAVAKASAPSDDNSTGAGTTSPSLEEQSYRYEKTLDKDFALDQTFQYSQTLIDFYPRFIKTLLYCRPPLAADLPPDLRVDPPSRKARRSQTSSSGSLSREEPGKASATLMTTASTQQSKISALPRVALDHSSILLLLSCHMRLIEVYENIFSHSHLCMHEALLPGRKPQAMTSNVPMLKIGSYTPPSSSIVHMHLLLLEQLNEQLLERVEELLSEIRKLEQRDEERFSYFDCDEGEGDGEDGREKAKPNMRSRPVDVTELTCLAVRDRARGVLDTVMWFRKLLIKYGWIRATPS